MCSLSTIPIPRWSCTRSARLFSRSWTRDWSDTWGCPHFDVDQLSDLQRHVTIAAVQPPLHIFRREATDLLLPYCREHQIGVFSYSALAHGFITGRFGGIAPTFPQGDWREKSNIFRGAAYEVNSPIVDRLAAFAATKGHAVGDLAIAWVLSQSGINAAVVDARSAEQVRLW